LVNYWSRPASSLLYKKLPVIFPEITKDDIKNAYMSELEAAARGIY